MFELYLLELFLLIPRLYLVGGCVRDRLLNKIPNDYDLTTDLDYDQIVTILTEQNWKVSLTGQNFLVLNATKNGYMFEIAQFRKESDYDGRRPKNVSQGNMSDDAFRRDFTINSLYENPLTGVIIDPTKQGLSDLNNRLLRFVGKPDDRIQEDYLRVFRFYRFIGKGFRPEKKSLQSVRKWFKIAYEKTTPERIRGELEKMAGI